MAADFRQEAPGPALSTAENEAHLIGSLLRQNSLIDVVADRVGTEDFSDPLMGRLFGAVSQMISGGLAVGPATVFATFQSDRDFIDLGGMSFLARISGEAVLLGVADQADQISEFAARRRLIGSLGDAAARASNPDIPLPQIVDESDAALVAAIEKRDPWVQVSAGQCATQALARIEAIQANDGKLGCTTGICDIDALLGGFEPGQFVIVAGRPGMGKTAVACSMATGLATGGAGVLFLSLEMKSVELGNRMLSDLAFDGRRGILFDRIINATVTSDELRDLGKCQAELSALPLAVVDHGSVTVARLALGIRRAKRRMAANGQDLKVVVIDYLQLLQAEDKRLSAYERVSEISRMLKAMANDMGIAIIALAQLSRAVEARDNKRPQLADLRDSGQLEQDADAVLFLYREEYYLQQKRPPKGEEARAAYEQLKSDAASRIEFICAKRRQGRTGDRVGYYFAHYQAVRGSDNYGELGL